MGHGIMAPRQHIRFRAAPDGVRIAVAETGRGPPLVRAAHWLSHVEYDLESPVWRPWVEALSRDHRYIRYDQRGCGLSDRRVHDFSMQGWLSDLEAVTQDLAPEPFPLLGMSQGGAVAIRYALRHPGRVSRLILVGAYAQGGLSRAETEDDRLEAETLVNLLRLGWGRDDPLFGQAFSRRFIPGGTAEQLRWWSDLERRTAEIETAVATLRAFQHIDVREEARRLDLPVLILHARGDACVPFAQGRLLAQLIPGARLVPLESDNHVLLESEPEWPRFLSELRSFLAEDGPPACPGAESLTPAERAVLALVAQGLPNPVIAARLRKREKTVRNQVSSILDKLGARSRAEAVALARDAVRDA